MATNGFLAVEVRCPFFKNQDKHFISCEGLVDSSNISLRYKYGKDKNIQFDEFCCSKYTYCEIYRMLINEKYQE